MPSTDGFVGTVEIETRGVSRLWFGLTGTADAADWVKIGAERAWFTVSLESEERAAELTLLLEAIRERLRVRVAHGGVAPFRKVAAGDTPFRSG